MLLESGEKGELLGMNYLGPVVHRDIKPTNIMVSLEEEDAVTAKIIDVGLAPRR